MGRLKRPPGSHVAIEPIGKTVRGVWTGRFSTGVGRRNRPANHTGHDRTDDRLGVGTDPSLSPRERDLSMRLCVLGLLFALAGCQSNSSSLGYRKPNRVDDPMLSIGEQQSRGRERYSYIEDDRLVPKMGVDRPDPTYGRN